MEVQLTQFLRSPQPSISHIFPTMLKTSIHPSPINRRLQIRIQWGWRIWNPNETRGSGRIREEPPRHQDYINGEPPSNKNNEDLGGGFKYFFMFIPNLGKTPNLTNMFQRGWNHQLEPPPNKNNQDFTLNKVYIFFIGSSGQMLMIFSESFPEDKPWILDWPGVDPGSLDVSLTKSCQPLAF